MKKLIANKICRLKKIITDVSIYGYKKTFTLLVKEMWATFGNILYYLPPPSFRKYKLPRANIRLMITSHCNLNCIGCNAFSPLAKEEFLSPKVVKNDLKKLSSIHNGKIQYIGLSGGEPLLHPDLLKITDLVEQFFPSAYHEITTNGILLNSQNDTFWENLKKNKFCICITRYPISLPFNEIKIKAEKFQISCYYGAGTDENIRIMSKTPLNLKGNENKVKMFRACSKANNCTFIHHGKIFQCPVIVNITIFNDYFKTNLKVHKKDYFNLNSAKNFDQILDFLRKPIPFCRYCSIHKKVYGIQWKKSEKQLSEWV